VTHLPPELVGPALYGLIGHVQRSGHVALGYIDPGTGSMVIQATLAAALTLPFVLRARLRAVLNRIARHHTQASAFGKAGRR
jgi:hypothetical protein